VILVKPPTIPIPFHKLLKVVALVDGQDPQTRELLAQIAAEHFEIEVTTTRSGRLGGRRRGGLYRSSTATPEKPAPVAVRRSVTGRRFGTGRFAIRIADVAVLSDRRSRLHLPRTADAGLYAKQVVATSSARHELLPPFFGGLMAYDEAANIAFDCPGHQGGQFYRKFRPARSS
jgi:ornithine decarboxylase